MEFVSPIIGSVVQSLMEPIKKHMGYLISSTKHVKDMEAKMKQLIDTAEEVQATWDNAVVNTEVVPKRVEPWLKEVKSLNERSNLIEAIGCCNVAKRYKVGKQSYCIIKEIEDLENLETKIVFTHAQKPLAEVGSTFTGPSTSAPVPMGTQNNFESRDLIFNAALQALQSNDESQKMIALCGMGGVGKTTMMEQLKKEVEASNMFDWVVKVVIGENPNIISLQQAISQYIGKDLNETDKDARADRLRKIFEEKSQQSQKKNLVIMDDLWNEVDLSDVGLSPLPNGFKMLFTSRFKDVCTKMGVRTDSIFRIDVLSKTEAKTLFSNTVRPSPSDVDDVGLQRIGEDIVMKCGGLPIAIVTIAKSLSGNIKEAWQEALWRLEKDDLKDLERITHRIFEMSYENLKEDEDKAIFLLCGLFPDDFDIRIEDLLRYGWGLNFFKDVRTLAISRRRMKICINNLIGANLLTKSDVNGYVKMHDLVRAYVLSNFSKVKQASVVNRDSISMHMLTKDANVSYERILLKCTDMCEVPTDFNYPNLSLLILINGDNLKFPEDFYARMEKLKVLSYEDLSIPMLSVAYKYSTELRTLCLRSCRLIDSDISSLGSLCNLEILSFVDCKLKCLPQTMGQLKKLKLLELTDCGYELCCDDVVFQNLGNLEELYMRDSGFRNSNLHELEKLSQGLFALELDFFTNKVQPINVSFKSLERFRISIGKSQRFDEKESSKNTLDLDIDLSELLECKISDLFEKVEKLWLKVNDMNYLQDVSLHHKFSNLTDLRVYKCSYLTYLFTVDVASSLKKLERLKISECDVLTSLVSHEDSGTEVIRFPKLNFMYLDHLPKMACLSENVIELPEMVELILEDLPNIKSIFPESTSDTYEKQTLLNKVVIPKLEKLGISCMENLKQIWPCRISSTEKNSVSMFRKITVRECDSLMNLFPCNPLPLLNHLEELDMCDCDSIEVLFNIDFESVSGMGEYNSSSKLRSITVDSLRKLKELWRMRGVNNSDIFINGGFKGVEIIKIYNCWRFTSIITPTTTNFEVQSLCISYDKIHQEMDNTYPSYLLHTYHHLQRLELNFDARVKGVLFELDSPLFLYALPTLQVLSLFAMDITLWKCNWNKFLTPQLQPSQDDENEESITSSSSHQNTTLFPCLDTLKLESLDGLKRIDGGQFQSAQVIDACWSLCRYPKHIKVDKCNELSSLIPWYAVGQMKKLEELKIAYCSKMKEVYESESISYSTNNVDEGSASGENITTVAVPQFSNLKSVYIFKCHLVQHVFTFSPLESLNQLKTLTVKKCKAIQVIVKEEDGMQSKGVVFPRLETLKLKHLPVLKGFFLGMNDFHWPSLANVKIRNCPQMMVLTSGQSKTPKLKYIHTDLGIHSIECDLNPCGTINVYQISSPTSSNPTISKGVPWSFHNLIEILMHHDVVEKIIPSHALPQLQKLQKIDLYVCNKVKEVFEVALAGSDFIESQTVIKIPNLTQMKLMCLDNLKYLWKSNQWMVLEFPNLTTVSIMICHSLEYVFTCSMVGSLVQLQDLRISYCDNLKVIVKEEEECDGKVNEIMLPSLKSLKLKKLNKLKGFCLGKEAFSLPALDKLKIKRCRAMTVFTKGVLSTFVLKVLKTDYGTCAVMGDLNSVIETKQGEDASSNEDDAPSNEYEASNNEDDAPSNADEASNIEDDASSNADEASNNEDDASS